MRRLRWATVAAVLLAAVAVPLAGPAQAATGDNTLLAVGDMADCTNEPGVELVASMLERTPGTIAGLGDLVYPDGSPQYEWLTTQLEARPDACRVAYWHHPRFSSSGTHGSAENMAPIVELLTTWGTEVILAGHAHHYERFAPLGTDGRPDSDGPRFFTVGTGGTRPRPFGTVRSGSEVRQTGIYGALVLTLDPDAWSWRFRAENSAFEDSGSEPCRNALDRRPAGPQQPPATEPAETSPPAAQPPPLPEPPADQVPLWYLYRAAFDRRPDAGGLEFWTARVRAGTGLLDVARAFTASPEFSDRYGDPGDADYLGLLYRNVLDREPDPGGFAFWMDQLRSRSRAELLLEFSWSVEFRAT